MHVCWQKVKNEKTSEKVAPGRKCRVIKGRKIAKGAIVEITRVNPPVKYSPSRWAKETINAMVKVFGPDGRFTLISTNIENLEVIDPAQYLRPENELRAEAKQIAAKRDFVGEFHYMRGIAEVSALSGKVL